MKLQVASTFDGEIRIHGMDEDAHPVTILLTAEGHKVKA